MNWKSAVNVKAPLIALFLGIAGFASGPANANLLVQECTGAGCSSYNTVGSLGSNDTLNWSGTYSGFSISGTTYGADSLNCQTGGCLVENVNTDIHSSTSGGSITILLSEDNLTYSQVLSLTAAMIGNLNTKSSTSMSDTRTFYLDPTNTDQHTASDEIFTDSGTCSIAKGGKCGESANLGPLLKSSGTFSITEAITFTLDKAGTLTSDDHLDYFLVPEPATLGIVGGGLVAVGALRRRRKNKKTA